MSNNKIICNSVDDLAHTLANMRVRDISDLNVGDVFCFGDAKYLVVRVVGANVIAVNPATSETVLFERGHKVLLSDGEIIWVFPRGESIKWIL